MKSGLLNGKVGQLTICTVGLHTQTGKYVASAKVPGEKPIHCATEEAAKWQAEWMYKNFMNKLLGEKSE